VELADRGPEPGTCVTGAEVGRYGDKVIERLLAWHANVPPGSWERVVQTFYGPQSTHELLERSTWHTAQHVRQLIAVLDHCHLAPDAPLVERVFPGGLIQGAMYECRPCLSITSGTTPGAPSWRRPWATSRPRPCWAAPGAGQPKASGRTTPAAPPSASP